MFTYFMIGVIVQGLVYIERVIRLPEIYADEALDDWRVWIPITIYTAINVAIWPITIIVELYNVKHGV